MNGAGQLHSGQKFVFNILKDEVLRIRDDEQQVISGTDRLLKVSEWKV